MAPAGSAAAAPLQWLGWDGRLLRWRLDAATEAASALCLDGVAFQHFPALAGAVLEIDFAFSPTGNRELRFSLAVDGNSVGLPWHVTHGVRADPGVDAWTQAPPRLAPLFGTPQLPLAPWPQLPDVAVIVPIHNAADSVRRCLAALAQFTPAGVRWILVDDASTDPAIAKLLAQQSTSAHVRIERHSVNRGYTSAVNTGIAAAGSADVVLLNSDTQVGPRWLESLRLAAWGDATVGTVTAVSDNAGAFSVPELEQFCPTPSRWSLVEAQRAVLQQAGLRFAELPTGNGFCLFVKHELIARIGTFDAEAFPAGYGEENDFCQRAIGAGFRNIVAGNVLVRHERSASFGDARRATLGAQGMAVLRRRWPRYEADVAATLYSFERRVLDYRVRRTWANNDGSYAQQPPQPRLLVAGMTDAEALRLAARDRFDVFALNADPQPLLSRVTAQGRTCVAAVESGAATDDALARWLVAWAIEQVQVPATTASRAILAAAAAVGIPVVATPAAAPAR